MTIFMDPACPKNLISDASIGLLLRDLHSNSGDSIEDHPLSKLLVEDGGGVQAVFVRVSGIGGNGAQVDKAQ